MATALSPAMALTPLQEDNLETVERTVVTFDREKKRDFDLEYVLHSLRKSIQDENTVLLNDYLNAFHELCRFFKLLGPVFALACRDIENKIRGVEYRMRKYGETICHSIQSMISYEVSEGKTHRKSPHPSGSRSLLRLHYILEFILAFMGKIADSDDDAKTSHIAWDTYYATLYNHHPWITQKVAYLAVNILPSKQDLIEIMCKHDYDKVKILLSDVKEIGLRVHNITESVYQSHNLTHIP